MRNCALWTLCIGMALVIALAPVPVVGRTIAPTLFSYRSISIKHIIERRLFSTHRSIAITI